MTGNNSFRRARPLKTKVINRVSQGASTTDSRTGGDTVGGFATDARDDGTKRGQRCSERKYGKPALFPGKRLDDEGF